MSFMSHFSGFFLFLSLLSAAHARPSRLDVVPPDYMPPPWLDDASLCQTHSSAPTFPRSAAVCDPSALLSRRQLSHLNSMLADIYTGTAPYSLVSCKESASDFQHGFRVAVALVRRMSFDGRTLSSRAENFANTLFDNWHLDENCGAGVLLFLSLEDRRIYIRTGRLAVKYFNEHQIDQVYAQIIPQLSNKRTVAALDVGISRIGFYLSKYNGKPGGARSTEEKPKGASVPLFFRYGPEWWDLELSIVAILGAALVAVACCTGIGGPEAARRKREKRRVLRKLDILRSEYVSAILPSYAPSTCPYCQDDLTLPWAPTVPVLPSTEESTQSNNENAEDIASIPTRTLRCGHSFHESCFDGEDAGVDNFISACPVCKDRGGGTSSPPLLVDTRQQDLSFRLHRLQERYPNVLTDQILAKLESELPDTWPDTMTDSYLGRGTNAQQRESRGHVGGDWWSGIGGLLAAGGIGAILASAFGGWGGRRGENSYYTDIPVSNEGGHVGRWGTSDDNYSYGGGHGAGWGSALSSAASRFSGGGLGRSWGSGSGGRGDGGGHGSAW